jgi:hypothetical protein
MVPEYFIVNIYALSGTSRRTEREEFYNLDLTYLVRNVPTNYVIGRDFNCVTYQIDCTRTPTYSKALDTLIRRFGLIDTWNTSDTRLLYTHYTQHGATAIDRLYMSPSLRPLKQVWPSHRRLLLIIMRRWCAYGLMFPTYDGGGGTGN